MTEGGVPAVGTHAGKIDALFLVVTDLARCVTDQ